MGKKVNIGGYLYQICDCCGNPIYEENPEAQPCVITKLDEQAGERGAHGGDGGSGAIWGNTDKGGKEHGDKGGASRFYAQADWRYEIAERLATGDPVRYCPKAAKKERSSGLDDFYWRKDKESPIGFVRVTKEEWEALGEEEQRIKAETGKRVSLRAQGNIHPTLKPLSLIKWISVLALPPKEYAPRSILIPFCGTFSEGVGAVLAGWDKVVGIDIHKDYCDISESRAKWWSEMLEETGETDPKELLKKKKTGQKRLLT